MLAQASVFFVRAFLILAAFIALSTYHSSVYAQQRNVTKWGTFCSLARNSAVNSAKADCADEERNWVDNGFGSCTSSLGQKAVTHYYQCTAQVQRGYSVSGYGQDDIRNTAINQAVADATASCGGTLDWSIQDVTVTAGACSGGVTREPIDAYYCNGNHLGRKDTAYLNAWCEL